LKFERTSAENLRDRPAIVRISLSIKHFGPATRVVREIKFGGENAPRPERGLDDFVVKAQVVELLRCLSEIGDGRIDVLEVKHGLPFRLILAEAPDPAA